jgi:integrase
MPFKKPTSQNWWISYYDPRTGKQVKRSAGPDFKEARALEQKLRSEAHRDRAKHRNDVTLDTVLSHYLDHHDHAVARSTARHLLDMAELWASALTQQVVRAHIKSRQAEGAAEGTINKELVMLSAAINLYNLDHGTAIDNPVKGLKLREPEGRLRWLTREEYAKLLSHCSGHLLDFVVLGVMTGMRKGELLPLRWNRIDFPQGSITLEAGDTKNGKKRTIPLNDDAIAALQRRKAVSTNEFVFSTEQGHLTDVKRSFATACRRAGIEDVTPHILRHTAASWMVIAGIPLYEVSKLLGHSSMAVTSRYAHLAPGNLRSAVDVLKSGIVSSETPGNTGHSEPSEQGHPG